MMDRHELDEAAECIQEMGISTEAVLECQKRAFAWREGL
jgi:hypothetical protein